MKNNSKKISQIRRDYQLQILDETHILPDPVMQLENWLNEAINSELYEPTAMILSTATLSGKPSSRVVLLKGISKSGLTFFTNYESKKGKEIFVNPLASINFFWPELERQVRVEGTVEKVSQEESVHYFHSRPRGSQLGAIASHQSSVIKQRDELEKKITELEKLYKEKEIPKPDHWGGYILKPDYFEFWQGRPSRLHDRLVYELKGAKWEIKRLAP
jgi:pyridoxamine-phosphate oxidase